MLDPTQQPNLDARGHALPLGQRPLIMGVINVTPDSFFPGSQYPTTEVATAAGLRLAAQGADMLDIGGESTRPGHVPVGEAEELLRSIPVVEALARDCKLPISIDTYKARVAEKEIGRAHV